MRAASAACAGCVISCWDEASRLMIKGRYRSAGLTAFAKATASQEVLRYFFSDGCTYPAVSTRADGRKLR